MSNVVLRSLYRSLLRSAKKFDQYPALKGVITSADFHQTGVKGLYNPCHATSFVSIVRSNFRAKKDGVGIETAFAALKYMNEIISRHYGPLYEPPIPLQPKLLPSSTPASSSSSTATSTSTASSSSASISVEPSAAPITDALTPLPSPGTPPSSKWSLFSFLRKWGGYPDHSNAQRPLPVYSATPILVRLPSENEPPKALTDNSSSSSTEESKPQLAALPNTTEVAVRQPNQVIEPGVVLVSHPLLAEPFLKCVLMVIGASANTCSLLILNTPTSDLKLGKNNYVFPEDLRGAPCYVGGSMLSLKQVPPVPNYVILHPYKDLPNCQVLIPHETTPVCMSVGRDIPQIVQYMDRTRAPITDFKIFVGTVEIRKAEMEHQVANGLWMPIHASPAFIHESVRLGRDGLWHGLLDKCGGEFTHMSLIGRYVE